MTQLLNKIPDPQVIREQLGVNVRQARILRRLIRVAEDVQAERKQLTTPGTKAAALTRIIK